LWFLHKFEKGEKKKGKKERKKTIPAREIEPTMYKRAQYHQQILASLLQCVS